MQNNIHYNQSEFNNKVNNCRLLKASDMEVVKEMIGKRVIVQNYFHGIVVSCNESPYGAFPASHYPVIVRVDIDFHGHANKEHAYKLTDIVIDE